jgi:hypothetical protein
MLICPRSLDSTQKGSFLRMVSGVIVRCVVMVMMKQSWYALVIRKDVVTYVLKIHNLVQNPRLKATKGNRCTAVHSNSPSS